MNEPLKNHEFYGKHWIRKEFKIHTARQGDYSCRTCEELRTKDWIKSAIFKRRKMILTMQKMTTETTLNLRG